MNSPEAGSSIKNTNIFRYPASVAPLKAIIHKNTDPYPLKILGLMRCHTATLLAVTLIFFYTDYSDAISCTRTNITNPVRRNDILPSPKSHLVPLTLNPELPIFRSLNPTPALQIIPPLSAAQCNQHYKDGTLANIPA